MTSGRRDRADLAPHPRDERLAEVVGRLLSRVQRDIGIDALALDIVRKTDDRGLRDIRVEHQRAFHLGGAHAVPPIR